MIVSSLIAEDFRPKSSLNREAVARSGTCSPGSKVTCHLAKPDARFIRARTPPRRSDRYLALQETMIGTAASHTFLQNYPFPGDDPRTTKMTLDAAVLHSIWIAN